MNISRGYSSIFVIFGVIVIIGLIAGISYLKSYKIKPITENPDLAEFTQPSVSDPQPTFSAPGETTISAQTGEKTYANKVLNFTITVPKNWNIADYKGVFVSSPGEVVFTPDNLETLNPYSTQIAVTSSSEGNARFPYGSREDFQKYLTEPISKDTNLRMYKIANLKVAGKDAMQYVRKSLPGDATDSFYAIITWVYANDMSYYFEFMPQDINDKNILNTYNQILSTIKFTKP